MVKRLAAVVLVCGALFCVAAATQGAVWEGSMTSGGGLAVGAACRLVGAIGQSSPVGVSSGDLHTLHAGILTSSGIGEPAEPVVFEDARLEQAVREAIDTLTGPIYPSDLRGLTTLDASARGIERLGGLEHCVDLEWLDLRENAITQLAPLSSLSRLTHLDLAKNDIVDLSDLSGLIGLTWLRVWDNDVSTLAPLSALVNLTYLSFTGNNVESVAPLASMIELVELFGDRNRIASLEGLQGLSHLAYADFTSNEIASIASLSGLMSLRTLYLGNNSIEDVSPLGGLVQLVRLGLEWNPLGDIESLAALTQLETLGLRGTQISSIGALSAMVWLWYLDVGANSLSEITALAGLTRLENLWIDRNFISSLDAIAGTVSLVQLDLTNNLVSDLTVLASLQSLEGLFISDNPVSSGTLTPLSGLVNLVVLHAWQVGATDLGPLSGLVNLQELVIARNLVDDLSPIASLNVLVKLFADHNSLVGIGVLLGMNLPSGSEVDVRWNYLGLSPGSDDMQVIESLLAQGVQIAYVPQKEQQIGCWGEGFVSIGAQGSGLDMTNKLGVDSTAGDCADVLDAAKPPAPASPYTRLWFEMDASCGDTQAYSRDVRASVVCEEVKTWTMKVTDDGQAAQVTVSWDPQELPVAGTCADPGTPRVTLYDLGVGGGVVAIDMRGQSSYTYTKGANPETRTFEIVVNCEPCHEECLNLVDDGWHMITLQGALCAECGSPFGDLCCALCDDLNPCFLFHYDPAIGGYVVVPPCDAVDFEAGMGLWANVGNPTTLCAPVRPQAGPAAIPLAVGWNQAGNPHPFSVLLSSARIRYQGQEVTLTEAHANGWVSQYLFGYDSALGGYEMVMPPDGVLRAVSGYWIRAYVDCVLVIPDAPVVQAPPQRAQRADLLALQLRGIATPPAPPQLSAMHEDILEGLEVGNYPNPVRSEHTTTFRVSGPKALLVDAIRVDIYDQSSQLVWSEEAEARETQWHTKNLTDELLANGVYLYQVWVRIGELWLPTGIQKVAVVR